MGKCSTPLRETPPDSQVDWVAEDRLGYGDYAPCRALIAPEFIVASAPLYLPALINMMDCRVHIGRGKFERGSEVELGLFIYEAGMPSFAMVAKESLAGKLLLHNHVTSESLEIAT